jgi:hypothetical protein
MMLSTDFSAEPIFRPVKDRITGIAVSVCPSPSPAIQESRRRG